ncbi:MAG: S-layer homology domain-containing protein [Clostridiales bacterium]|nr:S-layer homology domain-containing protein [Clostridiales bacterium]
MMSKKLRVILALTVVFVLAFVATVYAESKTQAWVYGDVRLRTDVSTVHLGDEYTYIITIENQEYATEVWENVVVTDELPHELGYLSNKVVDGSGSSGSVDVSVEGKIVNINCKDIIIGGTVIIEIKVKATAFAGGENYINNMAVAQSDNYPIIRDYSSVYYEPDATIEVSYIAARPGETVDVTYSIKDNTAGFCKLEFDLPYDRAIYEPISANPGSMLESTFFKAEPNNVTDIMRIIYSGPSEVVGDGLLFTVTYQVAATAPHTGDYSLSFEKIKAQRKDSFGNFVDLVWGVDPGCLVIGLIGDVNADGMITPEDAWLILIMWAGLIDWTPRALLLGDINGDGMVNSTDGVLTLWMVVGGHPAPAPPESLEDEPEPVIVVSSVTARPGSTVDITYRIRGNTAGFTNLEFELPYDSRAYYPVTVTPYGALGTPFFACNPNYNAGIMRIIFISDEGVVGDGLLFTVTYRINANALSSNRIRYCPLDMTVLKAQCMSYPLGGIIYGDLDMQVDQGYLIISPGTDIKYIVTFDAGDHGTMKPSPASERVSYGETVTAVPDIEGDPGYEFAGWKSSLGGVYDEEAVKSYPITDDITFTAVYTKINDAAVVFIYNGGVDDDGCTMKVISGLPDTHYTIPTVTRTGYTFNKDWQPDPSGGVLGTFGEAGSSITYTAQWIVNTYSVTFDAGENGTIEPADHTEEVNYGANVGTVPDVSPNTGYVFICWQSDEDGSVYTADGVRNYPITKEVTFTAQYTQASNATVIFIYNGGTARRLGSSYVSGRPGTTYRIPEPERIGYVPNGWSPATPSRTFGAAGSVTTYTAQWTAVEYNVIFKPGDHGNIISDPASEKVGHGGTVSGVPDIEADTGYVCIGWRCNLGGIFYDTEAVKSYIVTEGITFTAQYTDSDNATVFFNYKGGTVDGETFSLIIGKPGTMCVIPNPGRIGYSLYGWLPELPEEPSITLGVAGSVTSYAARWTVNSYTVTFEAGSNGKMTPENYSDEVDHGDSVRIVPTITEDSNYTFLGWLKKNGGGSYYSSEDILDMPIVGDVTFVAQYSYVTPTGGGRKYVEATLICKGVDKDSGAVLYNDSKKVFVGDTEKVIAMDVRGYALDAASDRVQSITIKADGNEIIFYYNRTNEPLVVVDDEEPKEGQVDPPEERKVQPPSGKITEKLETEEHIPYINGYPDGSVRPNGKITRAEVALIFWRLLIAPDKNDTVTATFNDIKGDEPYAQAVKYLARIDILRGYKDGSFKPSQEVTRAEFAAIAGRFDDLVGRAGNPFTDIAETHWAYAYIVSAYMKGWVRGYPNGEFRPQNNITRAEVVKIINCMLGRGIKLADLPADLPGYTDLTSPHWAYCEIMEATVSHQCERHPDGWEIWRLQ